MQAHLPLPQRQEHARTRSVPHRLRVPIDTTDSWRRWVGHVIERANEAASVEADGSVAQ